MSAPDTNIEKQARRHKGPLAGIPLAITLAAVAFVAFLAWAAFSGADTAGPQEGEVIEETSGAAASG